MRYYLGQCEYKWSHTAEHGNKDMEDLWIRMELGEELFKEINQKDYKLVLQRSNGIVPDIYCRCDIFVDIDNKDSALLFEIKHGKQRIERV